MRFLVHKRRSAPTVIIVALIDVLIVLLIFLMVTTTFKQQQSLRLSLPESSQAQKAGVTDNGLVVSIDATGMYFMDKSARTYEQIQEALASGVAKNPDLVLAINADEKAPWGKIVKLKDAAAAAHIKSLVALTKENGKP